jgi:hypothetical protein
MLPNQQARCASIPDFRTKLRIAADPVAKLVDQGDVASVTDDERWLRRRVLSSMPCQPCRGRHTEEVFDRLPVQPPVS